MEGWRRVVKLGKAHCDSGAAELATPISGGSIPITSNRNSGYKAFFGVIKVIDYIS